MNLSSLVTKGALIKGSLALSGVSGASVGGWYADKHVNLLHYKILSMGYRYEVTKPNLSSKLVKNISRTQDINVFEFKNGKCVETFFPGFEQISWSFAAYAAGVPETLSLTALSSGNEKSMGCVLMESDDTTDKKSHVVKSELTFKYGNRGFILWTGFLDKPNEEYHFLIYLEKNNANKWNFKSGYGFNASGKGDILKIPGSPENLSKVNKKVSYAGVWEESDVGGIEIFKDVYGKKDKFTNWHIISWFYAISNTRWELASPGGMDLEAKDYLPKILNIFKDKKGNWIEINSFCSGFSDHRWHLQGLCYEKVT